jgi:hypothetical protein
VGLYFLDTSALVKLYFQEAGSTAMSRLASAAGTRLAISTLGVVEFRAALRARQRRQDISSGLAEQALAHFQHKAATVWQRQMLNDAVFDVSAALLDRNPLRAGDALQLASCVVLHLHVRGSSPIFVCSDHALVQAARVERIPCWDPVASEAHP